MKRQWDWDMHTRELIFSGRGKYRVDLDQCDSQKAITDWIRQISRKPGITMGALAELEGLLSTPSGSCSWCGRGVPYVLRIRVALFTDGNLTLHLQCAKDLAQVLQGKEVEWISPRY